MMYFFLDILIIVAFIIIFQWVELGFAIIIVIPLFKDVFMLPTDQIPILNLLFLWVILEYGNAKATSITSIVFSPNPMSMQNCVEDSSRLKIVEHELMVFLAKIFPIVLLKGPIVWGASIRLFFFILPKMVIYDSAINRPKP